MKPLLKNLPLLFFGITIISISCAKSKEIEATYLPIENQNLDTDSKIDAKNTVPSSINSVGSSEETNTITVSGASTTPLNPEHGKPGHRCDLEVGAPLNTASSKTVNKPQEIKFNPNQTKIQSASLAKNQPKQTVPKGMNPPHGEPGHRCDIAVGASLKSPVTKPTTVTNQNVTPITEQQPAKVENPLNLEINPAHGEPGHSCSIGVGEPFKK